MHIIHPNYKLINLIPILTLSERKWFIFHIAFERELLKFVYQFLPLTFFDFNCGLYLQKKKSMCDMYMFHPNKSQNISHYTIISFC